MEVWELFEVIAEQIDRPYMLFFAWFVLQFRHFSNARYVVLCFHHLDGAVHLVQAIATVTFTGLK